MSVSKFQKGFGNRQGGSYVCVCCGKQTRDTGEGESSVELCKSCYIEALRENEDADNDE